MPTYDYACDECKHTLEVFQSFQESPKQECPKCGKLKLRRLISGGIGLVFKGSGFYVTDNRSSSTSGASTTTKSANTTPSSETKKATPSESASSSSKTETAS